MRNISLSSCRFIRLMLAGSQREGVEVLPSFYGYDVKRTASMCCFVGLAPLSNRIPAMPTGIPDLCIIAHLVFFSLLNLKSKTK